MDVTALSRAFVPHLSRSMPEVASKVPYIVGLDLVVFVGSIIASFLLGRWGARLDDETRSRLQREGVARSLREGGQKLARARVLLRVLGILTIVATFLLHATDRIGAWLSELLFVVVLILLLAPAYFAVTLLAGALRRVSEDIARS